MKNQVKKHLKANNETGNALIIVLIAIALLAALTFAVMRGDSSGDTGTLTKGEAKVAASNIMKYAKSVENAVRQLQLVNGCSEDQISFENSIESGYANANAPSECEVFGAQGTGLSWQVPSSGNDGSQWVYTGNNRDNTANTVRDLIMFLPNVDQNVCQVISENAGHNTILEESDWALLTKFIGLYPNGSAATLNENSGNDYLVDASFGCIEGGNTSTAGRTQDGYYYFFQMLINRR